MERSSPQKLQPVIDPARIEFLNFGYYHAFRDEGIIIHPALQFG